MMAAFSFLKAVWGACRSAIGYGMLSRLIKNNSSRPAALRYKQAWEFTQQNAWLFRGRELHANGRMVSWRNYVVAKLHNRILGETRSPDWLLEIEDSESILVGRNQSKGSIVVSVHSKLTFAIIDALVSSGHDPVFVRAHSKNIDGSPQCGQTPFQLFGVENIVSNRNLLLAIKGAVKKGRTVVVLIDSGRRRPGTLFCDRYLSLSVFEAAKQIGADLFFAAAFVCSEGKITAAFGTHVGALDELPSKAIGEQFSDFVHSKTSQSVDWEFVASTRLIEPVGPALKDFWITPDKYLY
jgi:hypothetical protein